MVIDGVACEVDIGLSSTLDLRGAMTEITGSTDKCFSTLLRMTSEESTRTHLSPYLLTTPLFMAPCHRENVDYNGTDLAMAGINSVLSM